MSIFQATPNIDTSLARPPRRPINGGTWPSKPSAVHQEKAPKPANHTSNSIYERSLPSLHFLRWRPVYHMLAANAWMSDPCAPGYDPVTGLYHLSFQWNPRRNAYGMIATTTWGHATSRDLISWTVSSAPSIKPGKWYDKEGCFTGCMYPAAVDGTKGLTIFYTGVSRLPPRSGLPYVRQTETLNVAHSMDGGSTWVKDETNPILSEPPSGATVTGWRDPMVAPWPSLDSALGRPNGEGNLYGLMSGGIMGKGPTAFLYAVNRSNMTQWRYICELVELGLNAGISRWSGDMGVNWDRASFTTLVDPEDRTYRELILVGGNRPKTPTVDPSCSQHAHQEPGSPRAERSQQWMCGTLVVEQRSDGTTVPKLKYTMGGRFDHGIAFGYNSFNEPKSSRQVVFGWITEEDLPQKLVNRQNWSGLMSLPKEVRMQTLRGVRSALVTPLSQITSIEAQPDTAVPGTYTIRTLGIIPARQVETLRESAREVSVPGGRKLQNPGGTSHDPCVLDVQSCRFELLSVFQVSNTCRQIGLSIFHTQTKDFLGSTTISLLTAAETLHINRPDLSHVDPELSTPPESAPFTLFEAADGSREKLEIRAWFDESVLEVFANERCLVSTRVYPATKRCWGIGFWAADEADSSILVEARAWDGLRAATRVVS